MQRKICFYLWFRAWFLCWAKSFKTFICWTSEWNFNIILECLGVFITFRAWLVAWALRIILCFWCATCVFRTVQSKIIFAINHLDYFACYMSTTLSWTFLAALVHYTLPFHTNCPPSKRKKKKGSMWELFVLHINTWPQNILKQYGENMFCKVHMDTTLLNWVLILR